MAEFCEVMRQAKRMCAAHTCDKCPLRDMNCECRRANMTYDDCSSEEIAAIERIVMDWAAKNPEPRYPTWNAWLVSMGLADVHGGANTYRLEINSSGFERIPADIAEKLGIKPIGGEEDA